MPTLTNCCSWLTARVGLTFSNMTAFMACRIKESGQKRRGDRLWYKRVLVTWTRWAHCKRFNRSWCPMVALTLPRSCGTRRFWLFTTVCTSCIYNSCLSQHSMVINLSQLAWLVVSGPGGSLRKLACGVAEQELVVVACFCYQWEKGWLLTWRQAASIMLFGVAKWSAHVFSLYCVVALHQLHCCYWEYCRMWQLLTGSP